MNTFYRSRWASLLVLVAFTSSTMSLGTSALAQGPVAEEISGSSGHDAKQTEAKASSDAAARTANAEASKPDERSEATQKDSDAKRSWWKNWLSGLKHGLGWGLKKTGQGALWVGKRTGEGALWVGKKTLSGAKWVGKKIVLNPLKKIGNGLKKLFGGGKKKKNRDEDNDLDSRDENQTVVRDQRLTETEIKKQPASETEKKNTGDNRSEDAEPFSTQSASAH